MKRFSMIPAFIFTAVIGTHSAFCQESELSDLGNYIQAYMDANPKPGFAACIIKNDSVYWTGNFGYANLADSVPVTDSTLFNAMSISKTVTAVSIMQLWEDGLIGLDENINNFLPFQVDNPFLEPDSITARFLMTHSSCIIDNNFLAYVTTGDPTTGLGDFLQDYLCPGGQFYNTGNFINQVQGTIPAYNYTNIGIGLNGYLAEVLTSQSFKDYSVENVLEPLEMSHAGWYLGDIVLENLAIGYEYSGGQFQAYPHYGVPFYPGMSLRTNVEELSHFATMLLNRGNYSGNIIIEPATADSMSTLQLNFMYTGLGLRRETLNCVTGPKIIWGHQGGGSHGYAGEFQMCKDDKTAIVYLSNSSDYMEPIVKRMLEYAAMIVNADAATGITGEGFTADWQEAPDADFYMIDLAYDVTFSNLLPEYQNYNIGADTTYQVTGLEPNTDYFYRIRAVNDFDTGAYSNVVHVITISGGNCLPEGIVFNSQEEIDNFQVNYPGCTEIEGDVGIGEADPPITDLSGLDILNAIGGSLYIGYGTMGGLACTLLTDLSGLENLTTIGGSLQVWCDPLLEDISALSNVTSIGGDLSIYSTDVLASLEGLENIEPNSIENISIWGNPMLESCDVVSICDYLSSPGGEVWIHDNAPGCNSQEEVLAACTGVSVPDYACNPAISVSPNPVHGCVVLTMYKSASGPVDIYIYNSSGSCIFKKQFANGEDEMVLNMADYPSGIYLLRISTGNEVFTEKIIKQ